jgi:RNA polymerase sigma-70 factor (ECF subfamily)
MSVPHVETGWKTFGGLRRGRPASASSDGSAASVAVLPDDEDAPLLRAGLAGDERAMAALLARHEPALLRLAHATLGNVADAEDAVQEAFLRALRALAGRGAANFRGDAAVKTWLHRIAVNVALEMRRKRRPAVAFDDLPLGGEEVAAPARHASPEDAAVERALLRSAFAALPPELRAAVALKEWEGWSVGEIAAAMGWNEKKAHNELYRARRALLKWREANAALSSD